MVTDQISGCTISNSIGLSDATFSASATAQAPNCAPVTVQVTVAGPAVLPLQYAATNSTSGQVTSGSSVTAVFNMTPLAQGTYTIQVKDNAGCIFTINNFAVTPNTPVAVTITPNLCGTPPTLTASGSSGYLWTSDVPGSIVGPTTGATITLLASAGLTTFTVTASGGACPSTQSTTVNLTGATTPTFTQSNPCDTQVLLTASPVGNYIYRWSLAGTVVAVGQQTSVNTSGLYILTLNDPVTGCNFSSAAQRVQVLGNVTASVTATQACQDSKPFTLTATTNAPAPVYAWYLNDMVINNASLATLDDQTSEGTYKVEVTDLTCKADASIQVIRAPLPVGKLPDAAIICNDPDNLDTTTARVYLNPGIFTTYNWFKNQISLNFKNQVYKATSEGIYQVDLTNSFGCSASDQTQITNNCEPVVTAPNAFRPSSSLTTNQQFYAFTFFITDNFQVFIFNRWGEMVFQSNDRNFKWNGSFNNSGPLMPGGTYAYVIKYVSSYQPEQGVKEKHGGVVLLR